MTTLPSMPLASTLISARTHADFLAALLDGDRSRCLALTEQVLRSGIPVLTLYQDLYQSALYQIGELWASNRISVAREHLATALVEGLLNQVYPRVIAPHRVHRRIVVASVEGELHQIGAKMVCDVFEMHGWDAFYLGADMPTCELLHLLREQCPDLLGLSLSVYLHLNTLLHMLDAVRAEFPILPILIGGQGLRQVGPSLVLGPAVHYVADLDALNRFVADWDQTAVSALTVTTLPTIQEAGP
ncbi:MAG TPA: cobalamin-dependent protein [Candidatus Competibacteraceae bacterium]|nr:MAG: cobalamin-binding protein [Candidatus Competibacteraceae bacterium]HQC71868.1 cobalamin-dependent protein [Candidatus Competibacteraceae bacterium]